MHGGDRIAQALDACGTRFLFTLCGGHISPILVGCKQLGIRVIDVRHEATAVFAADAVSRSTDAVGVAAVTAGPGATNAVTALENARMAQSPLVLLVGATATVLAGRGALQDIDQAALLRPHVKRFVRVRRVRDLAPAVLQAVETARGGVPGPVAVECPVDLLYDEATVRGWYGSRSTSAAGWIDRLKRRYLDRHVTRLFADGGASDVAPERPSSEAPEPDAARVRRAAGLIERAERPLLLVGSQAVREHARRPAVVSALDGMGIPVFLSGMARGLLGAEHALQLRHRRREALREADVVVLAGVPCDFRLDYGRHIRRGTTLIAANRCRREMRLNRRPDLAVAGDAGRFLIGLGGHLAGPDPRRVDWLARLRARDDERETEIATPGAPPAAGLDPLALFREIDPFLGDDAVLVADGGDFAATASYALRPRGPLGWFDPGPFGTLGVGAGFALGAKLTRPSSEVWILYGDGAAGYSLAEFDTFVRHAVPVIAVVGNDACWAQIARGQVEMLKDDVGCALRSTDYDAVATGFGGRGYRVETLERLREVLPQAREDARAGRPVLINALLAPSDFRKGSISI